MTWRQRTDFDVADQNKLYCLNPPSYKLAIMVKTKYVTIHILGLAVCRYVKGVFRFMVPFLSKSTDKKHRFSSYCR